jgi:transcription elongation factor GreA
MLENCEIVETTDAEIVDPGSIVGLRYSGDDDVDTYFYGSVEERGVEHDIISPGSPLGQALAGAKVGDEVSFESPTGATLSVAVVSIS